MGTLVSMRTASEPMWKPTFSAPNIWCRMPYTTFFAAENSLRKDVLTGVLLHFVKAPFPARAKCSRKKSAGIQRFFRQSVHAVPEDAVMLVHIGHIQRGTVRQGRVPRSALADRRPPGRTPCRPAQCARRRSGVRPAQMTLSHWVRKASCSKIFFSALHGGQPLFRVQFDDLKWLPLTAAHIQRKNFFFFAELERLRSQFCFFCEGAVKANNKRVFTASAGFALLGKKCVWAARVCSNESPVMILMRRALRQQMEGLALTSSAGRDKREINMDSAEYSQSESGDYLK